MAYLMSEQPEDNPFQGGAPNMARSDIRPLVRAQLLDLRDDARAADRRVDHRVTSAHLVDVIARIDAILEGSDG
jgi:hypothetical protein